MRDLKACSVALAVFSIRLTDETDREAPFSIDKTEDPADRDQSFLLIVWPFVCAKAASRIVARFHTRNIGVTLRAPEDAPGFPAFGRISLRQQFLP